MEDASASFHPAAARHGHEPGAHLRIGLPALQSVGMSTAATPKDQLRRVIDDQPDDSSFEEIIKELAFAAMIERGLADSRAGRIVSHEEMRRTLESWRK
jgi:predicted transcriptional regulator